MANLTVWDPFREMTTLRHAMDRLFENALVYPQGAWMKPISWDLALDVAESDDEYLVKASLPGINPDDLEITFNANVLSIKGETKEEKEVKESHYHMRERRSGSFSRSISLPSTIDPDVIEASYEAGVLTLHLPKAEEAKPKRIQVQSGESQKMIDAKVKDIRSKN